MSAPSVKSVTQRGRAAGMMCLAIVLTSALAKESRADFVMSVQSVTDAAGSTNDTLQVNLQNTGSSAVAVGGFFFQLTAGPGVSFTSVDTSTTSVYIFAGNSLANTYFGSDNGQNDSSLPGNVLKAADVYSPSGTGEVLAAGATVGLGDVHFSVASNATGVIAITLAGYPTSNLSDNVGNDITKQGAGTTFESGNVTVSATSVPTPSSLMLTAFPLLSIAGYRGWKRRSSILRAV